jgi:alkyldihydroxyacetonephosphate synthase
MPDTLSRRPPRRFWGWGQADAALDAREQSQPALHARPARRGARRGRAAPGGGLRAARAPDQPAGRAGRHVLQPAAGPAQPQLRQELRRPGAHVAAQVPEPPDWVAYPDDEQAMSTCWTGRRATTWPWSPMAAAAACAAAWKPPWAQLCRHGVAGPGAPEPRAGGGPHQPRRAHPGRRAGARAGSAAQAARPDACATFPQSFEFSTLGGWIATRAGRPLRHADDPHRRLGRSTRLVTPAGVMQTRRLPGSGAGPAPDRLVLGSEGTLGVITEAWVRLQERRASAPRPRCASRLLCKACLRARAGAVGPEPGQLPPAGPAGDRVLRRRRWQRTPCWCWALSPPTTRCRPGWRRALELVREHGGSYDAEAVARSMRDEGGEEHRSGAAGAWRDAFLRMPYWRDPAVGLGLIMDTFETAITWDRFEPSTPASSKTWRRHRTRHRPRGAAVLPLHARLPGWPGALLHHRRNGAADGSVASALAAWRDIKQPPTRP